MNEETQNNLEETEVSTATETTEENGAAVAEAEASATAAPEPKYINYDDFAKLDIRLGEIVSAEVVEDADKLFRLEVDFGELDAEEGAPVYRQIISGIREYFEGPEDIVGKKCPFVANLKPRVIRGLESQGMILAAKHEHTLALFHPHQDLPAGTKLN